MNFANVSKIVIPEGEVSKITSNGVILWQKKDLPSTYQQVEYIQADDNGAYIDLGITYDQGCTFEISLIYNGRTYLCGIFQNGGKRAKIEIGIDHIHIAVFNVGYSASRAAWIQSDALTLGESYTLKCTAKDGIVKIENMTTGHIQSLNVSSDIINYTCTENMYLLSVHYKGEPKTERTRTVKSFKYWDKDDNLLRDMIPCYRKSDNVIGMFDKVSQTFFTNAGTGTFTKGDNV